MLARLRLELLEDRNLLADGLWYAAFGGLAPSATEAEQVTHGNNLLQFAGLAASDVRITQALDLAGTFVINTPPSVSLTQLNAQLQAVPGFIFAGDYTEPTLAEIRKIQPAAARSQNVHGPFDLNNFLSREKNGEFPNGGGPVEPGPFDSRTNNNTGATGTSGFTQSETSLVAFGNTVVVGFNDSGSNAGGANKFTGFARSTDGGVTFTDGGTLPTSTVGDAGDPVLARHDATGRIYFSTLGFSGAGTIQMFRSDDNGVTWMPPVNATPGGSTEDKQWHTVDNFPGAGNGNVYVMSRRFGGTGGGPGIYMFRSTDGGNTFGPNNGVLIVTGQQGAFVTVGPDHSVYAFWYDSTLGNANGRILMRKSVDFGVTFGAPIVVATGLTGGVNGDLALTGIRQGTTTASGFRSNEFPHAVVSPTNGNLYVTFANNPAGTDKADIFVVQSTNGGATWSASTRVNDDATTTDQWQPTIAVSPDGSRLGVFYYSRQEDPVANNLFKFYGRLATLSGATTTFLPSFAISDVASLPEFGRDSVVNSVYMSDYDFAVATPGFFHTIWSDNRDDLAGGAGRKDPNVYYEKIALGLAVASTVPAASSVVTAPPTVFTVNVTDPLDPATVQAGDFLVNGIGATSVAYTPGSTTLTFTYATSPVTVQGLQIMQVPAGAFATPAGDPVLAFDASFRFDAVQLQVTTTVPPVNGIFTLPGPFTYDVNFNEPVDPASVQIADLALSGIAGAFVSAVTVLPGNTTARFTLQGITVEGALTASIAAGQITDAFGNSNAAFTGTYQVDVGIVPYPAPLASEQPLGSLIYDPVQTGIVSFVGDTDSFTLAIDAGQTISVLLTPTLAALRPSINVLNPASAVIASNTATAGGLNAIVQTVTATTAGTYSFVVSGASGTVGNYTLRVVLNAALEAEGFVAGPANNTPATAENINASFTTLTAGTATARRAAVQGVADNASYSASAVPFGFENISGTGTVIAALTNVDDAAATITPAGFSFSLYGSTFASFGVTSNGLITLGGTTTEFTNTDLTTIPAFATIAPFWDDLHTGGGAAGSNVFFQVIGTGADQRLTVQWNQIRFFTGGTAGDTITFQAQLFADGRIRFNYLDLVSGTAAGNNGASATVGIKAAGNQGPNRLLVAFNNGPNTFVGTGQSTLVNPPNPTPDLYAFTATAGQTVSLASRALEGGTVAVALLDPTGTVVATGAGGSTNVDQAVSNFPITFSGTYYARTVGTVTAPYNLVVTVNAAFDTEPNDSAAGAQPVGPQGVLGAIAPTNTYLASAVPFGFEDISTTGTVITGLTNVDDVSVSIPIGFNFSFYGATNTSVFVSSNGLLTFGAAVTTFTNTDLTTVPGQASIAPFWDDLHTGGGAAGSNVFFQVIGTGADQRLTIQWNQIRFFTGGTAGDTITFQAQLFADGRIRFNYLDLVSGGAAGNNGASATVGVKAAGNQGPNRLLLAFNNGPNTFVGTGLSTLVSLPPGEDWYSVTTAAGQTALNVTTSTPADGPGEFVNVLNPRIELYDATGTTLIASGVVGPDGRNETITAMGLVPGTSYRIRIVSEANTTGEYFVGIASTGGGLPVVVPTILVDNTNWGFSTRGSWPLVTGGFGGSFRRHAGNGDGSQYAQWQFASNFTAGTSYGFFVTWLASPTNASNARYKIFAGASQIGTVFLNQRVAPNSVMASGALWQSLFVYTPATTGYHVIRVQVDNSGNGNVIADGFFDPPLAGVATGATGNTGETALSLPVAVAETGNRVPETLLTVKDQAFSALPWTGWMDSARALMLAAQELPLNTSTRLNESLVKVESEWFEGDHLAESFALLEAKRSGLDLTPRSRRTVLVDRAGEPGTWDLDATESTPLEGSVAEQEPHQS